jgi:threonine aldolase
MSKIRGLLMFFMSDNTSGVAPEILAAMAGANEGAVMGYGGDPVTDAMRARFSEFFETEVTVFLVATGSAANSLSLAVMSPPYGTIFCHEEAHIQTDECCAPEFYTQGAKLVPLSGEGAKIDPTSFKKAITKYPRGVEHRPQLGALSLSQATEFGTVYSIEEIKQLSAIARAHDIPVHMDGARFANAVVSLGCSPADMTWRAGIEVLSFGATKNGAMAAEAVVFFNQDLVKDFKYRQKRAGQLFSKSRYAAAQFNAYFTGNLWQQLASHANQMAEDLSRQLKEIPGVGIDHSVDANQIFATLGQEQISALQEAGAQFYVWSSDEEAGRHVVRLVCAHTTTPAHIDQFMAVLKK